MEHLEDSSGDEETQQRSSTYSVDQIRVEKITTQVL